MEKIVGTRVCPVCGKEYPINEQGFYVEKDLKTTYVSCCDESDLEDN
jgi:hypothetical protein